MKRRDFLGTVMAAWGGSPNCPAQVADLPHVPRSRWIENGIIDAGGTHEPYSFVVRRGGQPLGARAEYESAESEETIRRLKGQGVEVFHTHLYKGFGMAAEMSEMRDTVRAAAFAHSIGMKVDTYVQWDTLMYETFFAEEPRAKDWIQRDASGRPILLTYGYQQSFRYRPCFANQEYLDYLKKVVRFAVEEARTDFLHFDNFELNAEPDSCHCPLCVRAFREFLRTRYTGAERRERFGFENVDYVNPPVWNAQNPPEKMRIIFDPAIQEWIAFRCRTMAEALRQLALFAKSLNREVVIETNPLGLGGENRTWTAGVDHTQILKHTQVFWTEDEDPPEFLPDGRLASRIRSYKLARTYGNILFTYIDGHPVDMAECLAFNQTIGFAGRDPLGPEMVRYIEFYRRHREYYTGSRDVAHVAVLRSYASCTYNHARAGLAALLAEEALIRSRVPFDLIFDEHLADLAKYQVLILPESECLSDAQLRLVRQFVEAGGGLVAIGQAGLYDQWRRLRTTPGLAGLVDHQPPAKGYQETVAEDATAAPGSRKEVARGRAVYLPALVFDGRLPEFGPCFTLGKRFRKPPKNRGELIEAVRWAAKGETPGEITGPEYLVAIAVTQAGQRRMSVHLVNFNGREAPVGAVRVTLRLPGNANAKRIRLFSPDREQPGELKFERRGAGVVFTVPQVKVYTFAAVMW